MTDFANITTILFDADGTLRRCTVEGQPCPNKPGEWELMPNVVETLARLACMKYGIASNQAGVALGYLGALDSQEMLYQLRWEAFHSRAVVHILQCCHAPDAGCSCRKPAPGMLWWLMGAHESTPVHTIYVGDMESDRLAAEACGVRFEWAKDFFGWEGE